jgi:hypothetical protein
MRKWGLPLSSHVGRLLSRLISACGISAPRLTYALTIYKHWGLDGNPISSLCDEISCPDAFTVQCKLASASHAQACRLMWAFKHAPIRSVGSWRVCRIETECWTPSWKGNFIVVFGEK